MLTPSLPRRTKIVLLFYCTCNFHYRVLFLLVVAVVVVVIVVVVVVVSVFVRLVNLIVIVEPNWYFVVFDSVLIPFCRTCWRP